MPRTRFLPRAAAPRVPLLLLLLWAAEPSFAHHHLAEPGAVDHATAAAEWVHGLERDRSNAAVALLLVAIVSALPFAGAARWRRQDASGDRR